MGFKNRQCVGQPNIQRQLVPEFVGCNCKSPLCFKLDLDIYNLKAALNCFDHQGAEKLQNKLTETQFQFTTGKLLWQIRANSHIV